MIPEVDKRPQRTRGKSQRMGITGTTKTRTGKKPPKGKQKGKKKSRQVEEIKDHVVIVESETVFDLQQSGIIPDRMFGERKTVTGVGNGSKRVTSQTKKQARTEYDWDSFGMGGNSRGVSLGRKRPQTAGGRTMNRGRISEFSRKQQSGKNVVDGKKKAVRPSTASGMRRKSSLEQSLNSLPSELRPMSSGGMWKSHSRNLQRPSVEKRVLEYGRVVKTGQSPKPKRPQTASARYRGETGRVERQGDKKTVAKKKGKTKSVRPFSAVPQRRREVEQRFSASSSSSLSSRQQIRDLKQTAEAVQLATNEFERHLENVQQLEQLRLEMYNEATGNSPEKGQQGEENEEDQHPAESVPHWMESTVSDGLWKRFQGKLEGRERLEVDGGTGSKERVSSLVDLCLQEVVYHLSRGHKLYNMEEVPVEIKEQIISAGVKNNRMGDRLLSAVADDSISRLDLANGQSTALSAQGFWYFLDIVGDSLEELELCKADCGVVSKISNALGILYGGLKASRQFAKASFCGLKSLNLSHVRGLTDQIVGPIVESCLGLEYVNLSACFGGSNAFAIESQLTDFTLHSLSRCSRLKCVELSFLRDLTDRGISYLAHGCHELEVINLFRAAIQLSDESLLYLASGCPELKEVYLGRKISSSDFGIRNDLITDAGVEMLVQGCPNLCVLDLYGCPKVGDASIVTAIENCKELEQLVLYGSARVTEKTVKAICESGSSLQEVDLWWCDNISEESMEQLMESRPDITIHRIGNEDVERKRIELMQLCVDSSDPHFFEDLLRVSLRDARISLFEKTVEAVLNKDYDELEKLGKPNAWMKNVPGSLGLGKLHACGQKFRFGVATKDNGLVVESMVNAMEAWENVEKVFQHHLEMCEHRLGNK